MIDKLEAFLELPAKFKALILLGLMLLIIAPFWFLFYAPLHEELAGAKDNIEGPKGLRFQIVQQQGIAKNLDRFMKENDVLEVELKKALQELPDEKEIKTLLASVSDVGRDAGLEIRNFKPRDEQKKDFYAEVPVEMEVFGTFHQLATFFDEVGHLSRIVNLDEFQMAEPEIGQEAVNLKTSVVATTFRFLEEKERIKPQESKDKRRAKKGAAEGKDDSAGKNAAKK